MKVSEGGKRMDDCAVGVQRKERPGRGSHFFFILPGFRADLGLVSLIPSIPLCF